MNMRIVYKQPSGAVSIVTPCDCGLTIKQIGAKDVPAGVPFWIVPSKTIPTDRTFRPAWLLDVIAMGEPSGYGGAV